MNKCDHMSYGYTNMTSHRWLMCLSLQICSFRCFSSSPFWSLMHSSPYLQLILTKPPFRLRPKLCTSHTIFSSEPTTCPFSTLKNRCVKGWYMQTETDSPCSGSAGGSGCGASAFISFQISYSAMWLELQGQQEISLRVLLSGILILWVCRQFLVLMLQRIRGSERVWLQPDGLMRCKDLFKIYNSSSFISTMLPIKTDPFSCAISEMVLCRSSRKDAQTLEAKLESYTLFSSSMTSLVRCLRRRRYRVCRPCLYASHYYYQEQQIPINIIKHQYIINFPIFNGRHSLTQPILQKHSPTHTQVSIRMKTKQDREKKGGRQTDVWEGCQVVKMEGKRIVAFWISCQNYRLG